MTKKLLYVDDDIEIAMQDINGMAMCHCEIARTVPSVIKRCRHHIERLQASYQRDAYGVSELDDKKHHRFLRLMGFKPFRNKWISDDLGDRIVKIWVRTYASHR